jgi:hypothetical protein
MNELQICHYITHGSPRARTIAGSRTHRFERDAAGRRKKDKKSMGAPESAHARQKERKEGVAGTTTETEETLCACVEMGKILATAHGER